MTAYLVPAIRSVLLLDRASLALIFCAIARIGLVLSGSFDTLIAIGSVLYVAVRSFNGLYPVSFSHTMSTSNLASSNATDALLHLVILSYLASTHPGSSSFFVLSALPATQSPAKASRPQRCQSSCRLKKHLALQFPARFCRSQASLDIFASISFAAFVTALTCSTSFTDVFVRGDILTLLQEPCCCSFQLYGLRFSGV